MELKTNAARQAYHEMAKKIKELFPNYLPLDKGSSIKYADPDYCLVVFKCFVEAIRVAAAIDIMATGPRNSWLLEANGIRPAAAAMEPIQMSTLTRAVNTYCSCGGKGPDDKGACDVCRVWHYIEKGSVTAEESDKDDGK